MEVSARGSVEPSHSLLVPSARLAFKLSRVHALCKLVLVQALRLSVEDGPDSCGLNGLRHDKGFGVGMSLWVLSLDSYFG